jgi:hypothetical protein
MLTACSMAWEAAGRPRHGRKTGGAGECLVCGNPADVTVRAKDALGANFDLLTARRTDIDTVCEACTWAMAGKPPNTLRMWSVAVTDCTGLPPSQGGAPVDGECIHLANRKDLRALTALITSPPDDTWAAAIAVSGQKHLLPYSPVNWPGAPECQVRYESVTIAYAPAVLHRLVGCVAQLRKAGHHSTTIRDAHPSVAALTSEGMAVWKRHAPHITRWARSPLLDLALHLVTKEHTDDLIDRHGH